MSTFNIIWQLTDRLNQIRQQQRESLLAIADVEAVVPQVLNGSKCTGKIICQEINSQFGFKFSRASKLIS
ncbi:MAG: hypothetical protein SAL07_04905 [Oscillatoria sp. PMC 1051.18]|nr:hypothetical protein [Oscillatoria sp. PMC 1050.18]MEC5029232.1 hypothetical protein [Oscillatoria sp. PMC 1051.18]